MFNSYQKITTRPGRDQVWRGVLPGLVDSLPPCDMDRRRRASGFAGGARLSYGRMLSLVRYRIALTQASRPLAQDA